MLDLTQIQSIAQSSSPQDLFAALVWQCRFNAFDGPEVIRDLALHPELWVSFLFSKPILAPDATGVSFSGVIETLLAMANYRLSNVNYFCRLVTTIFPDREQKLDDILE